MIDSSNGILEDTLQEEITVGYRPTLPLEALWLSGTDLPQITLRRDLEFMQMHPIVSVALEYYKSGISGAEFWGGHDPLNPLGKPVSADEQVATFVTDHVERFWRHGMPKLQDGGYPYGWVAGEHVYAEVGGCLHWSFVKDFHPHDAFVLTQDYVPVGIRIKNIRNGAPIDLWMASADVPAKACWYPHRPRFGHFYGRSQLIGAWRPWRRLGWRDGVEQVIDAAIYRGGYCGVVVKHPPGGDQVARSGIPGTVLDGGGHPRRSNRDIARQIGELAKAGASFTMSSEHYTMAQGGGPKWDIEWPTQVMDVTPLVEAARYVEDQIFYGVGVPPELIRASGTGSGYSGRNIPRESFLESQQHIADAMLEGFVQQVLRPLVKKNFGDVPFNIQCKSLLATQVKDKQVPTGGTQGGEPAAHDPTTGRFMPKGTQGPGTPSVSG